MNWNRIGMNSGISRLTGICERHVKGAREGGMVFVRVFLCCVFEMRKNWNVRKGAKPIERCFVMGGRGGRVLVP